MEETAMKTLSVAIISFVLVSSQSFAGGDCASKSAAFDSKIKKAIEVASFSDETVLKLKKLTADCHYEYNIGISSYQTNSCKKALDLVKVN